FSREVAVKKRSDLTKVTFLAIPSKAVQRLITSPTIKERPANVAFGQFAGRRLREAYIRTSYFAETA
ncbi:hypothetical protein, partial [Gordonibacter sp. KGMB07426]|uniref:hypothetical protein n=1 Tax=Gordonibacter sp. KGMB07426 TaxID=3404046 RepID=UPI003B281DCE